MSQNRHDILDLDDGYISLNRPKDAPPLTQEEQDAFRAIAAVALRHVAAEAQKPCGYRRT